MSFPFTLNFCGRPEEITQPVVMGILNVTPDSFYDGGRYASKDAALRQAEQMLSEGAFMLDIGGASSRPGAEVVPDDEESARVVNTIVAILKRFPEALISIDTWRASVARRAVEAGARMVNDISAGRFDPAMYDTVAELGTPYCLMHMLGTPGDMPKNPHYKDVAMDILDFFIREIGILRSKGVVDIILDPGFGFGKSVGHNYELLRRLSLFPKVTGLPVLAGVSRKSMIYKTLNITPQEALPATTALHLYTLQQGAAILRAHDVKEAVQVIKLHHRLASDLA